RLGAPRAWRELALAVTREHLNVHRALELRPATLVKLLTALDAWRRPQRFRQVLAACEADARGRKGGADAPYPSAAWLEKVYAVAAAAKPDTEGLAGPEIGRAFEQVRIAAVRKLKKS
ncbi:MAG: hypothetical protein ACREDC_12990, partial [Bradyrhizobium sp.]